MRGATAIRDEGRADGPNQAGALPPAVPLQALRPPTPAGSPPPPHPRQARHPSSRPPAGSPHPRHPQAHRPSSRPLKGRAAPPPRPGRARRRSGSKDRLPRTFKSRVLEQPAGETTVALEGSLGRGRSPLSVVPQSLSAVLRAVQLRTRPRPSRVEFASPTSTPHSTCRPLSSCWEEVCTLHTLSHLILELSRHTRPAVL